MSGGRFHCMPLTGRVIRADSAGPHGKQIDVWIEPERMRAYFQRCVTRPFPNVSVTNMEAGHFRLRCGPSVDGSRVMDLLSLLEASVTIDHEHPSNIDESHAIWLHSSFDDNNQASTSELGRLVYRAKEAEPEARRLAERFISWIEQHPWYAQCDVVAAVPSSDRHPDFYLPDLLSSIISARFKVPLVKVHSANHVHQEASKTDPVTLSAMFTVDSQVPLARKRVLVIDDTCETGGSIVATSMALNGSGATEVIALSACKTATACNGLSASDAHWGEEPSYDGRLDGNAIDDRPFE